MKPLSFMVMAIVMVRRELPDGTFDQVPGDMYDVAEFKEELIATNVARKLSELVGALRGVNFK